ncbi:MAG: tetratricopeptide repeat protein [Planctomycetota bacterium]
MRTAVLATWLLVVPAFAGATELEARLKEADTHLKAGRPSRALDLLSTLVSKHPESLEAHLRLQDVMVASGRGEELVAKYRERTESNKDNAEAVLLYARLLKGRRAVPQFKRVVKLAPEFVDGWLGYARALQHMDKGKDARRAIDSALKLNAASAGVQDAHGWLLESEGESVPAEAAYRMALTADADYLPSRFKLAHLLARTKRGKEALAELDAARKSAPGDPRVYVHRGLVLGTLGRHTEAVEALRLALKNSPQDKLLLLLLGQSYADLKEWELAEQSIHRTLEIDPTMAAAHAAAGYIALKQDKTAEAIRSFRHALKLEPKNSNHHYYLGLCYEQKGKARLATRSYRAAVKHSPKNVEYQLTLGDALDARNKRKEALATYRKATELAPEDVTIWTRYAHLCADAGRGKDAVKALQRAIDLDPEDLELVKQLGIFYEKGVGSTKLAVKAFRTYVEKGGKDERVRDWLKELGSPMEENE